MFDYIVAKYPRAQINGIHMLENASLYTLEQMKYWNIERVPKAMNIYQVSHLVMKKRVAFGFKFESMKLVK